jgi:hypothetical protein
MDSNTIGTPNKILVSFRIGFLELILSGHLLFWASLADCLARSTFAACSF